MPEDLVAQQEYIMGILDGYRIPKYKINGYEADDDRLDTSVTVGVEKEAGKHHDTHGGQLGEAYIHGMNGVAEAVRQVRGTAVNQVADVENVLVTAGTGVPTSGLILGVA